MCYAENAEERAARAAQAAAEAVRADAGSPAQVAAAAERAAADVFAEYSAAIGRRAARKAAAAVLGRRAALEAGHDVYAYDLAPPPANAPAEQRAAYAANAAAAFYADYGFPARVLAEAEAAAADVFAQHVGAIARRAAV